MTTPYTVDTSAPILVTGASGYVAGWIVKRLLEAGATVHGTVRDASNTDKTAPLTALALSLPGTLKLFSADLQTEGSFDEAMAGCAIVFHTASPFTLDTTSDAQKTFVEPALEGTRNVLNAANRTPSVKRVVLTSSCAAIYGDAADYKNIDGGWFTEENWNETSSVQHGGYSYSKTVAEREAWNIAKAQDQWTMATINPSMVIGPTATGQTSSGSFDAINMLAGGDMKMGAPRIAMATVDVRDVAEMQLRAAFMPEAEGRYITSATNTDFVEMGGIIKSNFPDLPAPTRALPKFLVWLVGPTQGIPRKYVSLNVGHPMRIDNSKSVKQLGMEYRPLRESIGDMIRDGLAHGFIKTG